MDIEELLRAGDDILEEVAQAIDTNNYRELGSRISDRVREAKDRMDQKRTSGASSGGSAPRREQASQNRRPQSGRVNGARVQNGAAQGGMAQNARTQNGGAFSGRQQNGYGQTARPYNTGPWQSLWNRTPFLFRRPGKGGSAVRTILGGLGMFVFGLPAVILLFSTIWDDIGFASGMAGTVILGALTAGAFVMLRKGLRENRLIERYYAYGRRIGPNEYFSVSDLAAQTGLSEEEIRNDLMEMMRRGYLPNARFDAGRNTMMLTEQAYGMYRQAEEGRKQREAAQRQNGASAELTQEEREICEILERGNAYIRKVRDINDRIPDTDAMSDKLYRQEEITRRIFAQVQKQPASAGSLRRFMDYYLPTTEKLLDAYIELEGQPGSGHNIAGTRQEILEAMDVVNDAFGNLLNSLFENMAWDISSDISAMKTMMAQDGLTENDWQPGRTVQDILKEKEKKKEPLPR